MATTQQPNPIGALTAVAYARGVGISDERWLRFTTELGYPANQADIDSLRQSRGADYLLQSESGHGNHTIRLFHRALADQLRAGRPASDERALYESLQSDLTRFGGWDAADDYMITYMADHAVACRRLAELLADGEFIGAADIPALISAVGTVDPADCPEIGRLILQEGLRLDALQPYQRRWLLSMSATHAGQADIRDQLLAALDLTLLPTWAHPLGTSYQKLVGHTGPVQALAIGRFGHDDVIASGGKDRTIRVWGHRGNLIVDPLVGHDGAVTALALGIVDDDDILVSGGADGTVRLWSQHGTPIGSAFAGHTRPVTFVGVLSFGGDDAIVSVAPQGEIFIRNPEGHVLRRFQLDPALVAVGTFAGETTIVSAGYYNLSFYSPTEGHLQSVRVQRGAKAALAVGSLGKTEIVACGMTDASIALYRPDGGVARDSLLGLQDRVDCISVGKLNGGDVLVAADKRDNLVVWNSRGNIIAEPWAGHSGTANVIAVGSLKSRDVVVCGGNDRTIRIWDHGTLLGRGHTNKQGLIAAIAVGELNGELRIVTSSDAQIRLWDTDGDPVTEPFTVGESTITTIAIGRLADADVIVTASKDRNIRIWDAHGNPSADPFTGHTRKINAIRLGKVNNQDVIVTAGYDNTVRIWSADGRELNQFALRVPRMVNSLAITAIDGHDALVVVDRSQTLQVLDLTDRIWTHKSPRLPQAKITCLAVTTLDDCTVVVVGCSDGYLRIWQPGQSFFRATVEHHNGVITGLAFLETEGSTVLLTTASDGVLRVWSDLQDSLSFPLSEPATFLAVAAAKIIIAAGPALSMLRYTPRPVGSSAADFLASISALEASRPKRPPTPTDALNFNRKLTADVYPELTETIQYARDLLDCGDHAAAITTLVPGLSGDLRAVCLAADAAYVSGQSSLIESVLPYLSCAPMASAPLVQGRLFVLAIKAERPDLASSAASNIGDEWQSAAIGLIRLLDRGTGEDEWNLYRRIIQDPHMVSGKLAFGNHIREVAATRLFAICRKRAATEERDFRTLRDLLLDEYWTWFDDEVAERLSVLLIQCAAGDQTPMPLLPYQVVSVYEVLHAIVTDWGNELKARLVDAVTHHLRSSAVRFQYDFSGWAPYSDLAVAVLAKLK